MSSAAVGSEATLLDLLARLPRLGPRPAIGLRLEYGLRWWSYADVYARSFAAAEVLRDAGVRAGDRVVLWGPSTPEWVGFFFGAVILGAPVVPMDDGTAPLHVGRLAEEVAAAVVVTVQGRSIGTNVAVIGFDALYRVAGARALDEPAADPEAEAVILFTSGTTSRPRGVVLTHRNLMSQLARFSRWRWWVRCVPYRMLVSAPLSHVQGLMLGICVPLHVGLSVIYTPLTHPDHLVRTLRDNRVTLFSTVPRLLQVLGAAIERQPYGRSRAALGQWLRRTRRWFLMRHRIFTVFRRLLGYRLWVVIVGGARLPRTVEAFWRHTGCLLVQGYGLTETAAVVSVNVPLLGTLGSVGKPLGHQDVRIAEDGEILVRGPNVTTRYYGDSTAQLDVTDGGYLRTGDLGRFDRRGRLFFEGRKKEAIVTAEGFTVHPQDIEQLLEGQPGVLEAVVLGLSGEGDAELHAVLRLAPGANGSEVVRGANAHLALHERLRSWTHWQRESFPQGALFKARRDEIAAVIQRSGEASGLVVEAEDEAATLDQIAATRDKSDRLRLLAAYIARGAVPPDAAGRAEVGGHVDGALRLVDDLGLSSLDLVELSALIEARFTRYLGSVVIDAGTTIEQLRSRVHAPAIASAQIEKRHRPPPRWASAGWAQLARRMLRPALLLPWTTLLARFVVHGREHVEQMRGPCIFVVSGHEHGSDVLTLYACLPARLRARLALVAGRWAFGHYLDPDPHVPWWMRQAVGFAFHVAVPLCFPLALTPQFGTTREGLLDACRLIDENYSLIVFGGEGSRMIAEQTGAPLVPVRLTNNAGVSFVPGRQRRLITVTFSSATSPSTTPSEDDFENARAAAARDEPPAYGGDEGR